MPQFMSRALGLIPQPAALFEIPGHDFVSANESALSYAREVLGPSLPEDPGQMARALGLDEILAEAEHMDEGVLTYHGYGGVLVYISRIPAKLAHPRPDLLLATMHTVSEGESAMLDHNRMILALNINETSEISMRVLENSLSQIGAALQAQADLVHTYNTTMGNWLHEGLRPIEKKMSVAGLDRT